MRTQSHSRPLLCLATLLMMLLVAAGVSAQSGAIPSKLDLHGGQVLVYKSDREIERVAVGNGELIEVTTIDKRQLVIIAGAERSGFTTLHLWYADGGQRAVDVTVNAADVTDASGVVRQMLGPDSPATVTDIGGKVVISGELTAVEAARVAAVAKIYPGIVDLTSADPVGMQPMVLMDVRIMEFNRNKLRDLGIRWDSVIDGPSGGLIKDFSSSFFRILPDDSPFLNIDLPPGSINPAETYFGIATSIGSTINLLTRTGDAFELASPQLSARSGGSANFLAGGEIPIPTVGGLGSTNVDFKEYGVKLEIQPVVNGNGEISTTILTEVSKIDPSVSVGGIPGFLTRRTETELNVRAGQTIVISGLTDITGSDSYEGIPGLANLPILGRLFRSDNFRAGRTDLVVFVTPRIIDANSPGNLDAIQRSDRMLESFKKKIGNEIFD